MAHPPRTEAAEHRRLSASVRFAGGGYPLFELETTRSLWLPDWEVLPVSEEGVTKPYAQHQKVHVQMAVPALWWKEHNHDPPILKERLYSEALHELTHPRQLIAAIGQIRSLQARYHQPTAPDDDDIIERTFSGNDEYG